MNFYLLDNLYDVEDDTCQSKVVRASSEEEARQIANQSVGDRYKIWENPKLVSCELLDPDGPSEEILSDYKNGW